VVGGLFRWRSGDFYAQRMTLYIRTAAAPFAALAAATLVLTGCTPAAPSVTPPAIAEEPGDPVLAAATAFVAALNASDETAAISLTCGEDSLIPTSVYFANAHEVQLGDELERQDAQVRYVVTGEPGDDIGYHELTLRAVGTGWCVDGYGLVMGQLGGTAEPEPASTDVFIGSGYVIDAESWWEQLKDIHHDLHLSFQGSAATGHLTVDLLNDGVFDDALVARYGEILLEDDENSNISEVRHLNSGLAGEMETWAYRYDHFNSGSGDTYPSYVVLVNHDGVGYRFMMWGYDVTTLAEVLMNLMQDLHWQ